MTRCYYAAYCRATHRLVLRGQTSFAHGWRNPTHAQLPNMIRANLGLPLPTAQRVADSFGLLRLFREDAEYRPASTISASLAADCLREAQALIALL